MIFSFTGKKTNLYKDFEAKTLDDFDISSVQDDVVYFLDMSQCYNVLRDYDSSVREVVAIIEESQIEKFAEETCCCFRNIVYKYVTELIVLSDSKENIFHLNDFRFDIERLNYFKDFIPDMIKPIFDKWYSYKPAGSYHLIIGCKGAGCHTYAEKLKSELGNSVIILFNSSNVSDYSYYNSKHNKCGNLIRECIRQIENGFNVIAIAWIENNRYSWAFAPARDSGVEMTMHFLEDSLDLGLCQNRRHKAMLQGKELYLNKKWLSEVPLEKQQELFRIRNKYINKVHFKNIDEWIDHMEKHEIMRLEKFKELYENRSDQLPTNIKINRVMVKNEHK